MIPESVREQFSPEGVYLNSASMGLPPRSALEALAAEHDRWRRGQADAPDFDAHVERSRAGFARLAGVAVDQVAIGPQVSVFTGMVAGSLPPGTEVLVPEGEFTSVTFPFWAQHLAVREVPLAQLADHVGPTTGLVATSLVQSADGALLDLDAVRSAVAEAGARLLLDVTQAAGWLPLDLAGVDYVVCGGYKFLLAPRGTAFLAVRRELVDSLRPGHANWYAGADPWQSIYGGPLRLAASAKRFDVSPAWHSWVGQAESLDLLTSLEPGLVHRHVSTLARSLAERLGLPAPSGAIMSVPVRLGAAEVARAAGVRASMRAGQLRVAFHLYNDEDDVDRAAEVLSGVLDAGGG